MDIQETVKQKEVTDYDFMFQSGAKLVVTLDFNAGDTVSEGGDRFTLNLSSKPSLTDPEEKTDEETLHVFKGGLAAINICQRTQRLPTEDELFSLRKTLHSLNKTVQ